MQEATGRHRAGNLTEAQRLYAAVLAEAPSHPVALFRSGLLELQQGRAEAARGLMEQAVAAAAHEPRYWFGLGQALQALQRWNEAIAAYAAALRLQPDFIDALNNVGICSQQSGRLFEAQTAYRQALALEPRNAGIMANLGTVLREMSRFDEAVELLRAAADLEPLAASHGINLGIAYCQQRDYSAAESILRQTLEREPQSAETAFNLGNALQGLGRSREAVEQYSRAAALRPDHADSLNNLGNANLALGDFSAALAAYQAALTIRPNFLAAINNAGCLLRTLGRIDDAEDMLRRGIAMDPRHPALHDSLGNVLKDAGDLDAAVDCFRRALELDPGAAATHSNLAYTLSFQSIEAAPILEECLRWNERFAAPLRPPACKHPNDPSPERRLRVGYVSPDFRDHCQSLFSIPLLSHSDHGAFEIFCYSSVQRPDDCTRRIAGFADHWRDVRLLDDGALAARIRADGIDILVDLTMHMSGGRPRLLARKPAPVQISWLAYPGTTGIGAVDYRLSDPRLDPPGFENHYSERTLRLADSFWCFDPLANRPDVNPLPAEGRGHLTFGCLNNPCKLTDRTLHLWGAVMRALPDSRLLLMVPPGRHRARLLSRLAAQGVADHRIAFHAFRPRADYLRSYHDIDLGLDTFPYNGHTTSLDSFWMGVPVITRVGETSVGRGGLSQLHQLNLRELAAESDRAFLDAAVALGSDLPRLAALRRELRSRLERSALMDGARFARNIETAYRDAWRNYCGGA